MVGVSYLTGSCSPEPFPCNKNFFVLRVARYLPKPGVTFRIDAEIVFDRRTEASIAEPIVVVGEEVDDDSTLTRGWTGYLDGSDVGYEVVHVDNPLVLIIRLFLQENHVFPAFGGQDTVGRELEVDDMLKLHELFV